MEEVFKYPCNDLKQAWEKARELQKNYQNSKIKSVTLADDKNYRIVIDCPWGYYELKH